MRLVFLGPPGAGKGTQAQVVCQRFGIAHISTGDMLREQQKNKTRLGEKAAAYMKKGQLVPDQLIFDMLANRFRRKDAQKGFVLDGFPRNRAQAEQFNQKLDKKKMPLDAVILFSVPDGLLVNRLTMRRTCPECGRIYHMETRPSRVPGFCDDDGKQLVQREDDREDVVKNRLQVYHEQTAPLIDFYRSTGQLFEVDASQEVARVSLEVDRFLEREVLKVSRA
ncbi:MAG: adenylate kinase [Candidatus Eremiobacterota bacterium]